MQYLYRHPKVYDFFISFIYPKKVISEINKMVGKNNSVFDIAAGYGRVAGIIDSSNKYSGMDLNDAFLEHGRRNGLDLKKGSVFDANMYFSHDVFLAIDILHHLPKEKLRNLFDLVFSCAVKKVIVVEPSFVGITRKYWLWGKFLGWLFRTIDDDGINKINYWMTPEEYMRLFENRFGCKEGGKFSFEYKKVGPHHLVEFKRAKDGF